MSPQGQPCARRTQSVLCLLVTAIVLVAATAGGGQPTAGPPDSSTTQRVTGSSPEEKLRHACKLGDVLLLKAAIAQRADVNCASPTSGLPPLLEMLRAATAPLDSSRRECVACLLAHGANPNLTDRDQRTAVICAARLGDLATLRLLVEAEANVRTRDRFHKTALFYAVEADRRDIARYLAQNGALISLSVKERRQMSQR